MSLIQDLKKEFKDKIRNAVQKYFGDNLQPRGPVDLDGIAKNILESLKKMSDFESLRGTGDQAVRESMIFCHIRLESKNQIKENYKPGILF